MAQKKHYLDNAVEYFHTLHQAFYLSVSVPLILFCVVYLRLRGAEALKEGINFSGWHLAIIIGMVGGSWWAYRAYRQRFAQYDASAPFRERLRFFHRAAWIKYAWLAAVNLLPVIGLYATGESLFLALYAVALVIFSLNRPTQKRVAQDLRLSDTEEKRLEGDQSFLPHES